jgi:L-ascorbate metabolism protein UlaG (beta-lactamase superfamily)
MILRSNLKSTIVVAFLGILIIGSFWYMYYSQMDVAEVQEKEIIESDSFVFEEVSLNWIVIGGFKLKKGETVVYIDPKDVNRKEYNILEPADYIIITHDHSPHYSPLDMYSLSDEDTVWITSSSIRMTRENQITAYPGDKLEYSDVVFEFVPSYNVDKTRPSGELFHPPELQNLGVVIDFDGTRIYHTGDSDVIPEMAQIETDIALLPVSGYAWMTARDAVEAVELLKQSGNLDYAIPIHYGYNQGTDTNALIFSSQVNCSVVILPRLFEKK